MLRILEPFIMLSLLMSLGAILFYFEIFDLNFCRRLSRMVVRVTFPALLFVSMYKNIDLAVLQQGWVFPIIGLFTSVILAFTAHYSARFLGLGGMTYGTYQILSTSGNNIFLPVPIIAALFGPTYIVYAFLFELGSGLFYWSYGISHFRTGPKFSLRRLCNLNMVALLFGLLFGLVNLQLPSPILGALELLGNITLGSALLIIGALTANLLRDKFVWRSEVWFVLSHRLILSPLIGLLFVPLLNLERDLKTILIFLLSMPPLVTTALVAANYDGDEELATLGVIVPTIFSFVLVPLVLYFFA